MLSGYQGVCGFMSMKSVLIVVYLASLGLGIVMLRGPAGPFWPAIFFLTLALPVGVFGAYLAALKRIHWLTMWSGSSLVVHWLSGAWLRLILSVVLAFIAAALLSIRFSVAGWPDVFLVGVCAVLVGFLRFAIGGWLLSQYQPVYRHGKSLLVIAVLVAAFMSLLDPLARFLIGAYDTYANPAVAIESVRSQATWLGSSSISQLATEWGAFWVGWERFILGRLLEDPNWISWFVLLISGLLRFPLYLAVCFTVCAFVLPQSEYKRILLPSKSEDEPSSLSPKRIALASATVTISVLFIYLPIVGVIESTLSNRPTIPNPERVIRRVEVIGDQYFSDGSLDEINQLSIARLAEHEELLASIEDALASGFSLMRANVDVYLDWYYSLPAEWGRVATLLAGNIDDYLATKLTETLEYGEPFEAFEQKFAHALSIEAELIDAFREQANEILESRRVEVSPGDEVIVVARVDRDALLTFPIHSGLTTIEQRLATGAAASGVSGIVAAFATRQVILRATSSGAIRAAGAAIARLAMVRAGSAGTGGLIGGVVGGTLGSVVPGFGTALGAAIGGAIGGLAVGVGAEFLMLKLDELWSREDHHQQLIMAINETESEILQQLRRGALVEAGN